MSDDVPRRIALVLGTSDGGTGRHVADLAAGLLEARSAVVVAGPRTTDEVFGFTALGARHHPVEIAVGPRPLVDAVAARALRRAVVDADLVHAHGLRAGLLSGLVTPRHTPLVVTWHNAVLGTGLRRSAYALLERRVARWATVTLAASADLLHRVRSLGAHDARLGEVGVAVAKPGDAQRVRAELDVGDAPLVLAVSRLHPQKGLDTLVAAAGGMGAVQVLIAGEGPQRPALERQIAECSAPVRLLGRRSDVPDLLAAADVVVLPSRWEARALVAQEAARAGRPIVATTVGGMRDLLGDAAHWVPAGDPVALAVGVRRVLDDPALADSLAAAAHARAAAWPTAAEGVAQVLDLYTELLGGAS